VPLIHRRCWLLSLASSAALAAQQKTGDVAPVNKDWVCPMDPDVRSDKPGVCPRCGMKLVLTIPERIEYPFEIEQTPEAARAGQELTLTFLVRHPDSGKIVRDFEIVHEKLIHLFVVSECLEYFAHEHPVLESDGTFKLSLKLPYGGMYRLLADFYPTGATPQLALGTIYLSGRAPTLKLVASTAPCKAANLTALLRCEPPELLAGLESRLTFSLSPSEGLEPYLGAWGHMLAASSDLIDLMHLHPFLVTGGEIQFNVIFPRAGLYRVWTQFQRSGQVNTTVFTVPVKAL
jgi:hypothetical protein